MVKRRREIVAGTVAGVEPVRPRIRRAKGVLKGRHAIWKMRMAVRAVGVMLVSWGKWDWKQNEDRDGSSLRHQRRHSSTRAPADPADERAR
ncbi:unnamed protein product [Heligmosomoides polygyrus]|uniref:Uncharacterized protein n=1 Tax=Heligmosomoides polygyrus TaxID=6339 RepID=A0A183FQ26_HELPZ|nr:unnamed protein product [Heligmosomoides polygyrus]